MNMSMCVYADAEVSVLAHLLVNILHRLGLLHKREYTDASTGVAMTEINNMTLINLCLKLFGPMHEQQLTLVLLGVQALNTLVAFSIRFAMAGLVYDVVR
jgi:UDP-N-acetylglucosamine--dolichyl-phosphate N-acetylglucosaminephosphotransferase